MHWQTTLNKKHYGSIIINTNYYYYYNEVSDYYGSKNTVILFVYKPEKINQVMMICNVSKILPLTYANIKNIELLWEDIDNLSQDAQP